MIEQHKIHLRVDKEIVPLLSKSTYIKSFSHAVREMVSNAYDADALSVKINIERNLKDISIVDDGNGMTFKEFEYFCTIAGQKREINFSRKYKRKRIGQFGIGFLSIFPFCEYLEVKSTVENSTEILQARIPAKEYFDVQKEKDIQDIDILVKISKNASVKAEHYTSINLINPTFYLQQYFTKETTRKRDTIRVWDPFDKFTWELEEDLPISYAQNSKFSKALSYDEPIGLNVFLNKKKLFRNEPCSNILSQGKGRVQNIEYKYVITTDYKSIKPLEFRGMKLRINNVGVGERNDFELKRDRGFPRLHWLNGEILATGDIKKFLSISRDSLLIDPLVENFNNIFKDLLSKNAYYVDSISEAEKAIKNTLSSNKTVSDVRSKKEIIKSNLKLLESRGYVVVEASSAMKKVAKKAGDDILPPIHVDKSNKIITLYNPESYNKDVETVFNKKYKVIYRRLGTKNRVFPCKMIDNKTIEINEDYPLFKSRQYGYLFKKIHLLLLIARKSSKSTNQMYLRIVNAFLEEFKDFQT